MNFVDDLMEDEKTLEIVRSVESKLNAENPMWKQEWFERTAEKLKEGYEI